MRPAAIVLSLIALVALAFPHRAAETGTPRRRSIPEDERIIDDLSRRLPQFTRVTRNPYRVEWEGAPLCVRPHHVPHTPHGGHWIHVFVSPEGTNAMISGTGSYPTGTIILKRKFADAQGKQPEFFTGMRKREKGYNPEMADWEFFILDAPATHVLARGRIESCMDCHTKYSATDFVSRRYLTTPPLPPR